MRWALKVFDRIPGEPGYYSPKNPLELNEKLEELSAQIKTITVCGIYNWTSLSRVDRPFENPRHPFATARSVEYGIRLCRSRPT
jgi:hypothetical protein